MQLGARFSINPTCGLTVDKFAVRLMTRRLRDDDTATVDVHCVPVTHIRYCRPVLKVVSKRWCTVIINEKLT